MTYLKGFLEATSETTFMPKTREEITLFLNIYLLEKAVYELRYELNNRPDWVGVPVTGILEILHPADLH